MKTEQFVRLTAPGMVFGKSADCRLEVVERTIDEDGTETSTVVFDLSKFVTGLELPHVKVGELTRCRVDLLMRDLMIEADVERFLVQTFKPRRRVLWALRRLGDLTWRVREWVRRGDEFEVTTFGSPARTYLPRRSR